MSVAPPAAPRNRVARRGRSAPRTVLLAAAVTATLAAAIIALWPGVIVPIIRNADAHIATSDERVALQNGADAASLVAPAGWLVSRMPWERDTAVLRSPDGVLEVTATLDAAPAARAVADHAPADAATLHETLASGLLLVQARSGDRLDAAVATSLDAGTSVLVAAHPSDAPLDAYLAALAAVLESVKVGS